MCLFGSWKHSAGLIVVVSGGSRTLARSLAVSVVSASSREPQLRALRPQDHRGMVLIWRVREVDVEAEEVMVVRVRSGVRMSRSVGSP